MVVQTVIGAEKYGVYAYIKHFALNDQEINRTGMLCTWSNDMRQSVKFTKTLKSL